MDRRQHINSSLSKTSSIESVKQKTTNGNVMNINNNNNNNNNHQHIGYRRNSTSIDSSASANYRKSFPTTSDNSLNNSIQDDHVNSNNNNNSIQHSHSHTGSINTNLSNSQYGLTQAGLEEYSRSYYEQNLMYNHQKQSSYAQSEGYHSYVSSSDSTSTPFLDRLRQDSQLLQSRAINWSQEFQTQNNLNSSTNSISSTSNNNNLNNNSNNNNIKSNNSNSGSTNDCSESTSSSETLKWLGSMSDVSVASQATNTSTLSASSQLIVHSSKVRTPQRHNSESVLYMNDEQKMCTSNSTEDLMSESSYQQRQFQQRSSDRSSRSDNRLFPINTYTEPPASLNTSTTSLDAKLLSNHNWQSVADRINELEKQQQQQSIHDHNKQQFTYLDPNKTHRISNPTLKAFQKNAIQSYFERQQQQTAKINKPSNNSTDDMSKIKSICGELASSNSSNNINSSSNNSNNNNNNNNNNYNSAAVAGRPQSLNLSLAPQLPMNMQTPSSSSSSASQRSSISGWPSSMPSSASSTMASPTSAFINGCNINNNNNNNNNMMMMKNNANVDITKMNMKNNAITSMLGEKQLLAGMKMNKNQSIVNGNNNNRNMFTSFCEIKTEKYSSLDGITSSIDNINHSGLNSMTPPPPPPRSKSLMPVRRTSSASEYSSIRDKMLHQKQHLSKDLLGPMIMGQIISVDDWVPERPPKTSTLRVPSPELPPPPVSNVEHLSTNQDDPLPPPPPELLRQQMKLPDMNDVKLNPASRRNSFAGQSNVPPHVNNMPPAIPMRPKISPNPIMTVSMNEGLHRRPSSGMDIVKNVCQMPQEQTVHAQRIMVVPKMDDHQSYAKPQQRQQASPQTAATRVTDSRVSQRKRTHNSKDCTIYATPIQPPPLKPRMRNQNENINATSGNNVFAPIATKSTRSTSKASYLPRQPREKLLDPDHGSYKLTLHELSDNVSGEFQADLQKCNLPDVLPVGVKYHNPSRHPHHHPQQRPPHHFSQHFTPQPHYHPTETHLTPQTAPILSSNALKSIFHFQMSNPGTPTSSSNPSNPSSPSMQSSTSSSPLIPSSPFNGSAHKLSPNTSPALLQSPKYTSQSSIDMKKTQSLDPKLYTNEELIKTYREQKEACRELNKNILNNYEKSLLSTPQSVTECDKIAVVRKLNMVESPVILSPVKSFENLNSSKINNKSTESLKSLEEKATNEKSEKDIIIENEDKAARETKFYSPIHTPTLSISPFESEFSEALNHSPLTEITVRVNPVITTQETASQTEEGTDDNTNSFVAVVDEVSEVKVSPWTTPVRQKYPEEVDCEKLSKDLVSQLSPSDKLHHILAPKTYKSSSDYISDLFKINVTSRPTKKDVSTSTLEKSTINSSMEILTPNSAYFSTSEPKAKLMTRYSREMTLVNGDSSDLTKKKEELVTRLGKKLVVLTNEQTMLVDESTANDVLGNDVALKVAQKVRPGDSTKFRSYVDDVGYITMLLLSLSGRLARTENALHSIGEKTADKKILEAKRDRLLEQLEEAKHLKEDIDRRGSIIASILENALTTEEYADYDYFINMKAKLIVDSREIADKIKLGEEQLNSLKDTLVQSEC